MKNGLPAIGIIAALAVAGCGTAGAPATTTAHQGPAAPTSGRTVPDSVIRRLTLIADRAITSNDGHGVEWATAVVTTRKKALTSATPGDFLPNDKKTIVYLVTIKGHFVAQGATGPPGSRAPRGRYLSLVIAPKNFAGLDFGLSPKAPPVAPASLGPVIKLKVHAGLGLLSSVSPPGRGRHASAAQRAPLLPGHRTAASCR